jgi:serum/glucocorticoid-regulated kinase 2
VRNKAVHCHGDTNVELKETHLSAAFSPKSSDSLTKHSGSSSASSSTHDLSTKKTPISLPSVTAGHHSPGRKAPSTVEAPDLRPPLSPTASFGVSSDETRSINSMSSDRPTSSSTSTIKPGLLGVSISKATGLSLPPGHTWPTYVLNATGGGGASAVSGSVVPSSSISPRKQLANPSQLQMQRDKASPARRRPPPIYLVVEYDKTQVILDAVGGTVDSPVWDKVSNFDVSRVESLSIQVFGKIPVTVNSEGLLTPPKQFSVDSGQGSVNGYDLHSEIMRKKGYQEVFLGTCKIEADLSKPVIWNGAIPLSSGTGKIEVRVDFKPNRNRHLTIDDFDLLKVVGKGSFGKVMQVRKIDTRRIYALKTIRKAHIISRSEVNHTLAERTVLAQIDNPFIVPLKFSFQSPEKLYLVLAFINGGELFHHLQREGRFDLNRSRFYTAELLCALECLHEYNVIYRDLKPENILLDYTGHIALCDFGLCKLNMAGQEKTNTFCGTPEYLAPELLLGQGYTKVVDWWTLGVLFYEMLTGLPPFYDQDTNEMYRKILQDPLRFPDDMDREARSLLQGLLNRDPKKRLGVNGAGEIRAHPFFAQIDWKRLINKKYAAPFKPSAESATDTSNFDQEFTSEEPTDSVVEKDFYLSDSVQRQFGGWTYTNTDSKLASSGKW